MEKSIVEINYVLKPNSDYIISMLKFNPKFIKNVLKSTSFGSVIYNSLISDEPQKYICQVFTENDNPDIISSIAYNKMLDFYVDLYSEELSHFTVNTKAQYQLLADLIRVKKYIIY